MAETLWTSQTPALADVFEAQPVTVGITVNFSVAGSVTGGQFYAPTTIGSGTFELVLYQVTADDSPAGSGTGTLLGTAAFGTLTPGAWNNVLFAAPIAVTPGVAYRIGVRTSEGRYAATGGFFNASGLTNLHITAQQTGTDPVGIGPLDNGSFIESITLYMSKTFNGNAYFVGPLFEPAGTPVVFTDTSGGAAGAGSGDTLARTFTDTSGGGAGAGSSDSLARVFVDTSGGAAAAGSGDALVRGLVFTDTSGGGAGAGSADALATGLVFTDTSGGTAGAGSVDALARGLVFTDTSGGAAGAGSADTLPTAKIFTDTSGGAAGAGSPDPSTAPAVKKDTMVMPLLTQALQCLREQASLAPAPPAHFHVRPGADFEQQADQYGDECCDGIGWVRLAANYEGSDASWIQPVESPANCPPSSWAVVIEVGLMRCIPLAANRRGDRVTDEQWSTAAEQQMDDAATLRRVLCCLREVYDAADIVGSQVSPLPNSGGCGGVTMQVTMRADACDCT